MKLQFPIEFVKPQGTYDFLSAPLNLALNSGIVAGIAFTIAAISALAIKAFGVKTVIPQRAFTAVGIVGFIGFALAGSVVIAAVAAFANGFMKR